MESARIVIEVTAGLIPGQPNPAYTKQWVITSKEWNDVTDHGILLATKNGTAQGYAGLLMLQPDTLNWVRIDWIYL